MRRFFKKKYVATLGMLMTLSSQVNGVDCEPNCCDTPSGGLGVHAELLYWRPELCGLEAAFGNTTIATTVNENAITTTSVIESQKEPHSKWDAGFRIGADLEHNGFDIELDWTHFDGRAKFREHTQFGHWKVKYDVVDLIIGHRFSPSSCSYVQPFIGLRGAWIHQKLKSHLETLFTSSLIGNNTVFTDKDDKEDFCGVGPQLGVYAEWCLGCNLSLYGKFAVITYYGDVKGRNFDSDTFTSTVSVCSGKKKHCFNNVATDAALGIRWDSCSTIFCGCDVELMLKLGVEQQRIYDFSDLGSDGNFSLDGGVFAAGINFVY